MRLRPPQWRRGALSDLIDRASATSLLLDRRRRGHLAVLSAVLLVSVFGYLLLQPRDVRVLADGRDLTFATHQSNDSAVLGLAGVRVGAGDRVTALDGDSVDVLQVERARRVVLTVDGETYTLRSHARTIDQVLDEAGIAMANRDSVLIDGIFVPTNSPVEPPVGVSVRTNLLPADPDAAVSIEVRRAVTYTIVEGGRKVTSTTSRPTVAQALREAGVTVGPGDRVIPDLQARLEPDGLVEVQHAIPLTVTLPDDHIVIYTFEGTVGEALAAANVRVPDGALIDPTGDTRVTSEMSVRVVTLSAGADIAREFIESRTVYRTDPSLAPGQTRTETGHDGARVRRYAVSYVNGEEAGRELIEEYFDPEPVDTVIYYPPRVGSEAESPPSGAARTLRVYATWYNPASAGRPATDPAYGRTATGVQVTYGIVAVDPAIIPLGTRMFIPGYGEAVAADTGGAVKGYIIDLGFPDGVDVQWQSRWLEIYILE